MILRRFSIALCAAAVLALAGCGFHLRKEANLPASMKKVHIQTSDPSSPLAKELAKALPRSGTEVVDAVAPDVAVMNISANNSEVQCSLIYSGVTCHSVIAIS